MITLFCIALSPNCKNLRKTITRKYFAERYRIKEHQKVITIKESEFRIKQEFANFNEKDKDGVFDTIRKLKIDLDELMIILLDIVSFAEKIRNLFLWEDPQKTAYFCCGLIIIIYLVYSIPFRLLVLIIGVSRFLTGRKKTQFIINNNKRLCHEVLSSLFAAYLSNYYLTVDEERPWGVDLINNINLQKKIVEKIRAHLDLDIDITIFQKYPSPKLLLEALSSCEALIKHRNSDGHISEKSKKESQNLLAGFLSNIPSEYYRYLHPRLGNIQS